MTGNCDSPTTRASTSPKCIRIQPPKRQESNPGILSWLWTRKNSKLEAPRMRTKGTLIRQYDIGAKVELTLVRGADVLKVPVELMRSPKLRREMKKYRNEDFEFTARDVAFFDRAEEQWSSSQRGALVEDVKSGSWAELGSLYVDDLIVEVDGQPV